MKCIFIYFPFLSFSSFLSSSSFLSFALSRSFASFSHSNLFPKRFWYAVPILGIIFANILKDAKVLWGACISSIYNILVRWPSDAINESKLLLGDKGLVPVHHSYWGVSKKLLSIALGKKLGINKISDLPGPFELLARGAEVT